MIFNWRITNFNSKLASSPLCFEQTAMMPQHTRIFSRCYRLHQVISPLSFSPTGDFLLPNQLSERSQPYITYIKFYSNYSFVLVIWYSFWSVMVSTKRTLNNYLVSLKLEVISHILNGHEQKWLPWLKRLADFLWYLPQIAVNNCLLY